MAANKTHKKLRISLFVLLGALIVLCAAFFIYVSDYYHTNQDALPALASGGGVTVVESADMITFAPDGKAVDIGFAFYPGGKVEWTAYAPLMRSIAQRGIVCVLLKMPFNLAVFDIGAANRALAAHPEVKTWYVGGHSLGGSMVAAWCAANPEKCRGLVLMGSYSASDLSKTGLKALVIVGSEDHVLNREALEKSKAKMPADTTYDNIPGGNHGDFGDYGEQAGDGTATIPREEQQNAAADAAAGFMGVTPTAG